MKKSFAAVASLIVLFALGLSSPSYAVRVRPNMTDGKNLQCKAPADVGQVSYWIDDVQTDMTGHTLQLTISTHRCLMNAHGVAWATVALGEHHHDSYFNTDSWETGLELQIFDENSMVVAKTELSNLLAVQTVTVKLAGGFGNILYISLSTTHNYQPDDQEAPIGGGISSGGGGSFSLIFVDGKFVTLLSQ